MVLSPLSWGGGGGGGGGRRTGGLWLDGHKNVIHIIDNVFTSSLYNILHKDVEQDTLSQWSMPLATMP